MVRVQSSREGLTYPSISRGVHYSCCTYRIVRVGDKTHIETCKVAYALATRFLFAGATLRRRGFTGSRCVRAELSCIVRGQAGSVFR